MSIGFFGFMIALTIMIPFLLFTFLLLFVFNVDWYSYTGHLFNNTLTKIVIGLIVFLPAYGILLNYLKSKVVVEEPKPVAKKKATKKKTTTKK